MEKYMIILEKLLQENQDVLKRMKENDVKGWDVQTENFKKFLKKMLTN